MFFMSQFQSIWLVLIALIIKFANIVFKRGLKKYSLGSRSMTFLVKQIILSSYKINIEWEQGVNQLFNQI